jgi:hypothetical protein
MRRTIRHTPPHTQSKRITPFQIYPRHLRPPSNGWMPWSGPRDRFHPESLPLAAWFDPGQGVYKDAAAVFNGTTQYLSYPDAAAFRTGDIGYTFGGWFSLAQLSRHMLISKGDEYYVEYSATTSRFRFVVDNTHQVLSQTIGVPSVNQWYFIVCWHDPVSDLICLQINDGAVDSAAYSGGSPVTGSEFNVGAYSGILKHEGSADSVFFQKRLLSPAERTELYNAGAGKSYSELSSGLKTSLISWWSLDESSGTRTDSHGGNGLVDHAGVSVGAGVVKSPAQVGDAVSLWISRAGQGLRANQSAPGKRPLLLTDINGVPYLSFDGVDDLLEINNCAACFGSEATLVAAFSPQNANYSLYHASAAGGWWAHATQAEFGDFRAASIVGYPTGTPLIAGNHVVSISSSSSVYEVRVDGSTAGERAGSFSILDKQSIGGSWETGDRSFAGRLHGIFLCNRALAPHRLQQAERCLANKSGALTL